jgi:hypothetical protein
MGYCLRPGLSFCSIEGQDIFLDVPADRYFSLKSDVAEAFRTLREEGDLPASKLLLLKRFGLIEQVSTTIDLLPDCLDRAVACSIAMDWTTPAIIPALRAWSLQLAMERFLRRKGFAATIARLRRDKDRRPLVAQGGGVAERWIQGFEQAKILRTPASRCLPRSLALATCLLKAGHDASLAIGVQIRPFLAHCWVQQGDVVLNDTPEDVAAYTPILVI